MNTMHLTDESLVDKDKVPSVLNCLLLAPCLTSASSSYPSFAHYKVPMLLFTKPPNNNTKHSFQIQPQEAPVSQAAARMVRHLHRSIVASAADTCLSFLSSSPFLQKLLSLSCHFQRFSKNYQRNYIKMNSLSNHNFAAILPGDSVAGVVAANGILNFLNIYNTLLVVRLVLTWFPNSPPAIVSPLSTLCDPYLNIFRGIIPPLGGTLDLSPILAFLVLNAFTSAAAALPAELPPTEKSHDQFPTSSDLTATQKKWMTRIFESKRKNSNNDS